MKEDLIKEITLDEGVNVTLNEGLLTVKGPKGEVQKNFLHPKIEINIEENKKIVLKSSVATKREKTIIGSFEAHIKNMVKGVQEPFQYILKICSGHFPMNVSVSGQELVIKNFLGEAVPRKVKLLPNTEVKVDGDKINITSANKEAAGQNAAKIETACRVNKKDRRIFQDGCYIIHKAGKDI